MYLSCVSNSDNVTRLLSATAVSTVITVVNVVFHAFMGGGPCSSVNSVVLNFTVLVFKVRAVDNTISPLGRGPRFIDLLAVFGGPFVNVLINVTFATILRDTSTSINVLRTLSVANSVAFTTTLPVAVNVNIKTTYPMLLSSVNAGGGKGHATLVCLLGSLFKVVF